MQRSRLEIIILPAEAGSAYLCGLPEQRESTTTIAASAGPQARISPAKVDLVLRQSDFDSVNYAGAGHNRVIVQGMPAATVPSTDCDGPSGARFPIQNVFVVDEFNTYITDVVVCSPSALAPGTRLSPIGPAEEHAGNVRIPFEQE